jgi:hypothetical protein
MTTKKVAPKKVAPKKAAAKPAAKKAAIKVAKIAKTTDKEQMVLYTIRLQPSVIAKIEAVANKEGVKHAVISRNALNKMFGKAA